MSIRIGIMGYGNLGRGAALAVGAQPDMSLCAIFTRRDPSTLETGLSGVPVYSDKNVERFASEIDVMILCGGSKNDLPTQTPALSGQFNVVDSFDTHAAIPDHYKAVDAAAKRSGKIGIISAGWDPGLFSINRLYASAVLQDATNYTFWGNGVSQGHSTAIRTIPGVRDARQYTVPVQDALDAVRSGTSPTLTTRQKHTRECYVVAEENADLAAIEQQIVSMPNYFADYDTTVTFITEAELHQNHATLPHGGFVITSGHTAGNSHIIEYSLKLDSNPEFTASVLVAYARAAHRLNQSGQCGCLTPLDIAPTFLSPESPADLRAKLL